MSKNILKIGIVRLVVKNKFFPIIFRISNLIATMMMIYIGWGLMDERLRYTNLTSFLIWVVWWPGIILAAIFTGRGWCTLCHQKLISDVLSGYGLKWKLPEYIAKYGTTATVMSVFGVLILHSTVSGYNVNHIAGLSSLYLLILLIYVVVISFLFEKGSFCKSFCPLVGFLGIYSRCCPIELGPEDPEKCKDCKDKQCKKHCLNELYIGEMDSQMQEGCLFCFECAKHCPNENVSLSIRGFFKGLWDSPKRTTAEAFSVIFLLGIVNAEVGEQSKIVDGINVYVSDRLAEISGFGTILDSSTGGFQIWEVLWILMAIPLIIIGLGGIIAKLLSKRHDFSGITWNIIKMYSLGLVPLILGLHATKMLQEFDSKIGYLPDTMNNLGSNAILTIPSIEPLLPNKMTGYILTTFFMLFGICGSLYSTWKISKYYQKSKNDINAIPFMLIILILGSIFIYVIYNWLIIGEN